MATYTLNHGHLVFVGGFATFRVRAVSVAVLAVEVSLYRKLLLAGGLDFGNRGVEIGDMFFEERCDGLVGQTVWHGDKSRPFVVLLFGAPPVAVLLFEAGSFSVRRGL